MNVRTILLTMGLLGFCIALHGQDMADSTTTPFRKGRWILGLTGSVTSGSVQSDSIDASNFTIEYSLRLSGIKLIADRWGIGGFVRGERNTPTRFIERETEVFLFGPEGVWYLSDARTGSAFLSVGIGYSRFRDNYLAIRSGQAVEELTTGQGIGLVGTVGYAVAIADRIVFELGLDASSNWIWAERQINNQPLPIDENIRLAEIAFSFGFKVLL